VSHLEQSVRKKVSVGFCDIYPESGDENLYIFFAASETFQLSETLQNRSSDSFCHNSSYPGVLAKNIEEERV